MRLSIWQTLIRRKLMPRRQIRKINSRPCRRPWRICSIRWIHSSNRLESSTETSSNASLRALNPEIRDLQGQISSYMKSQHIVKHKGSFRSTWGTLFKGTRNQRRETKSAPGLVQNCTNSRQPTCLDVSRGMPRKKKSVGQETSSWALAPLQKLVRRDAYKGK